MIPLLVIIMPSIDIKIKSFYEFPIKERFSQGVIFQFFATFLFDLFWFSRLRAHFCTFQLFSIFCSVLQQFPLTFCQLPTPIFPFYVNCQALPTKYCVFLWKAGKYFVPCKNAAAPPGQPFPGRFRKTFSLRQYRQYNSHSKQESRSRQSAGSGRISSISASR